MLKCCEILWNPVCSYFDWNLWKPKCMFFIAFPCCRFCIRPRSSPQSLIKATAVGRFRFDPGNRSGHRRSTWLCNWDLDKWNAKPKPPLATCCCHRRGRICDLDEIGKRRPDPTLHATGVREIPLQLVPVLDVPSSWKLCQIFVSLPNSWSSSVVKDTTCPGIGITLQRKCDVGLSAWSWHRIWQDLFRSLLTSFFIPIIFHVPIKVNFVSLQSRNLYIEFGLWLWEGLWAWGQLMNLLLVVP